MELNTLIGITMIYSLVHFFIIHYTKPYKEQTKYEKFVCIYAIVSISLVFIGIMARY